MTQQQTKVIKGLAAIERKHYCTAAIAVILKQAYAELRRLTDQELEKQVTLVIYS